MGWLKKVGIIVAKTAEMLALGGPIISSLIPGKRDDQIIAVAQSVIGQAIQVIVQVEAIGAALSLDGAAKLKGAVGPISEILLQLFKGRKIKDVAKYRAGVEQFTSGLADILSSLDDGNVDTDKPTA
jgi:hypothetical protein